jgi:hypothetical protein
MLAAVLSVSARCCHQDWNTELTKIISCNLLTYNAHDIGWEVHSDGSDARFQFSTDNDMNIEHLPGGSWCVIAIIKTGTNT